MPLLLYFCFDSSTCCFSPVMLPPAILNAVQPVGGKPRCLNVTWSRSAISAFPVSRSEIQAGALNSEVEITAGGPVCPNMSHTNTHPPAGGNCLTQFIVLSSSQPDVQAENVTDFSFLVCLLTPDTSYTIRLRHRYRGSESPWSPWSNKRRGATAEDGEEKEVTNIFSVFVEDP